MPSPLGFAKATFNSGREMPVPQVSATAIQALEGARFLAGTSVDRGSWSRLAKGKRGRREGTVPAELAHSPTSDVGRVDRFMNFFVLLESTSATGFA